MKSQMFHITLGVWSVIAAWKWADLKNWKKYHSTMLFMSFGNLVYSLLVNEPNFFLWRYNHSSYLSPELTAFLYCIIAFPATVITFLSNYPKKIRKQFVHIVKYAAIYVVLEIVALNTGNILHSNGWSIWWSIWFDLITFSVLQLHHESPLKAYLISALITGYLLFHFHVPLWDI